MRRMPRRSPRRRRGRRCGSWRRSPKRSRLPRWRTEPGTCWCVNALKRSTRWRAHLAENGMVAPIGVAHVGRLAAVVEIEDSGLPEAVMALGRMLVEQIATLSSRIEMLDKELRTRAAGDDTAKRLMTIRASARSPQRRSPLSRPLPRPSPRAATSPPGSGSHRASIRAAARSGLERSRRWVSGTSAGC